MVLQKATCVKFAKTCLAAALALGAATTAEAAVVDLGGGTTEITTADGLNTYKNNEVRNGILNVSANQGFADATFTFGGDLVINQTSGKWGTSGGRTVKIVDGCTVNYTSGDPVWFGRTHGGVTYNGTTQLILDNGTFNGGSAEFGFPHALANSSNNGKNVVVNLLMNNHSLITTTSDIRFGEVERKDSKSEKTVKITGAVTNSSMTAKAVRFGQTTSYISDLDNSFVNVSFGPGSDVTCQQFYAYQYPQATVTFDGTTVHWLGNDSNVFGRNANATNFEGYRILSRGLTFDLSQDMSHGANFASLIGEGGFTKTGSGTLTYNRDAFQFTGPLTVSNGVMISSQSMAASAFNVDGASSELRLSGALTNANVTLTATAGGQLTLAGATLSDASPDLVISGTGSTTDYFTRDGVVGAYPLDSFTLGAGAVLNLDADTTGADAIIVAAANVTATTANPVTINLNFLTAPAAGQVFKFFATDDAAKFTVNPKLGGMTVPNTVSIIDGCLALTVTAEDYTWRNALPNWGDADAWTMGGANATWTDGNNAIFTTPSASATLAANVAASKVAFNADGEVTGSATLTVPDVSVATDVSAAISAPTAGVLTKTGAGALTLTQNRTDQTTLSEGTLKMDGATLDVTKLALGTDAAKPVTLDYGGQTLTGDPRTYLGAGMDVSLTNGVFTYGSEGKFEGDDMPATLTIAMDATFSTENRFNFNPYGEMTINVAGGQLVGIANANNWMMQHSLNGRLNFNVTDGGLVEFGGEAYLLTCRDAVAGSTAYQSPSLYMKVVDSTVRVKNGKSIRFGRDDTTKSTATPVFSLAATNSVFDLASGIYIGNDLAGLPTEGSYRAEFDSCVITAYQFCVFSDRTLNNALLNGTHIVFNKANSYIAAADDDAKWMTVGPAGLVIDSQTYASSLRANLGGTGPVTKIGSGKMTIEKSQTSSAALDVNEGSVALNGGLTLARATTVKSGTTFTVNATETVGVSNITFEAGSTLNIASYTPGTVMAVTTLALPASGTVALTYGGAAFKKGVYGILSKAGITVADVANLVPSTGDLVYEWSVVDNTLVLNVGEVSGNAWTGLGGDRKMSTGANWLTGVAPVAGDTLDFSSIAAATTIIADMGDTVFNTVNLGSVKKGVTIDGTLHLSTMTVDATEVNLSVAENAKLIVDGDVTLTWAGSSKSYIYIVYDNKGEVEVRGKVIAMEKSNPYPCCTCSTTATIAVKGIRNESTGDHFKLNAQKADAPMVNWIIATDGLTNTGSNYFWVERVDGDLETIHSASLKAAADFSIEATIANRKHLVFDTDLGYTITINGQIYYTPGSNSANPMTVKGSGKVVCNYTQPNSNKYNGLVTVTNTATLAVNPGKVATIGGIAVAANATLEVAQSGTVTLEGNLTLNDGAILSFNYTNRNVPVLDVTGKTVTFGSQSNVVVKISAADGKTAKSGDNVLTSGGAFTDANVSLVDKPDWVKGVSVVDGNIVIDVKPSGLTIFIK